MLAFAIDMWADKYPLPPLERAPPLGEIGVLNWRQIIEQVRLECNSIDIFNSTGSPEATFTGLYELTVEATAHIPIYNFLLCTTSVRNNTREFTFLEMDEAIPKEYNKHLINILEQLIYEQIIYRAGFIIATAQYIEKKAAVYLSNVVIGTHRDIFNIALLKSYPSLFHNYEAQNIKETISSTRGKLIYCIDDVLLYFNAANELVKKYVFSLLTQLTMACADIEKTNADIVPLKTFLDAALDITSKMQTLFDQEEQSIQIQYYGAVPFFSNDCRIMKMTMERMLQTSLAKEKLKVRAYKHIANSTIAIYSLEPKNIQLKYMLLFTISFHEPSMDIIQNAYRKELIPREAFENILSTWMSMHYMHTICQSYTTKERIAYYIRYICSDGTLDSFNGEDIKYLYRVALYADALFSYRRALISLDETFPNAIRELSAYIEDDIMKEFELEGGFACMVKPDLVLIKGNKLSIEMLRTLVNKEVAEFKGTAHCSTLPYKTNTNVNPRKSGALASTYQEQPGKAKAKQYNKSSMPANYRRESSTTGTNIFKKITTEKNSRFLVYIDAILTTAIAACDERQRAARVADLAAKAAMHAAIRKEKEAKKLEQAQAQEKELEKLKKEEEAALRKNLKNRRKKQKKREAARAKAEKQDRPSDVFSVDKPPKIIIEDEQPSQSDASEKSGSTSTTSRYLTSSSSPSSSHSPRSSPSNSRYSLTSLSPARNIPVNVLSQEDALPKLTEVFNVTRALDTCDIHQSVYQWMGSREDLAPYKKAYHCHDVIDFFEAFSSGEEMAHYFLVLVCKLSAREYISLYAPATLYIADDGFWHTENGYLVVGGFYPKLQYGCKYGRLNLHHLRLSSVQSLKHAHIPADAIFSNADVEQDGASATMPADTHRHIFSPLRELYQKENDMQHCQLIDDTASDALRLVYYTQLAGDEKRITRVLKIMALSDGNTEQVTKWATAQFKDFLNRNTSAF